VRTLVGIMLLSLEGLKYLFKLQVERGVWLAIMGGLRANIILLANTVAIEKSAVT